MSLLSKSINRYVEGLLAGGEEIVHADAAQQFIADHDGVIGAHVTELVASQITAYIKARSQAPAPPLGQGVLFAGLPAAVTVRDGVTKPISVCTRGDLVAGRVVKVDNIAAAQAALKAYDLECRLLLPHMTDDEITVDEVVRRVFDRPDRRTATTG